MQASKRCAKNACTLHLHSPVQHPAWPISTCTWYHCAADTNVNFPERASFHTPSHIFPQHFGVPLHNLSPSFRLFRVTATRTCLIGSFIWINLSHSFSSQASCCLHRILAAVCWLNRILRGRHCCTITAFFFIPSNSFENTTGQPLSPPEEITASSASRREHELALHPTSSRLLQISIPLRKPQT